MLYFSIPIFILLVVYSVYASRQWVSCATEWEISAAIIVVAVLAARGEGDLFARRILLFGCCVAGVRYLIWRICCSIHFHGFADVICCYSLLAAEIFYILQSAFTTFLYWRGPKDDLAEPVEPSNSSPQLAVFIATLSEPTDILRRTISGALNISYPNKTIYVLDDGNRPAVAKLAESMGCKYIIRPDRRAAKAGNINNALAQTHEELILTLDADHVPAENIMNYALPVLNDPKVWGVQFAQRFLNPGPLEKNLKVSGKIATELQAFFEVLEPALNSWSAAFWAGSGAVLRRSALEEVGGVAEGTVIEDKHTSFKLNQLGYRLAYVATPQVLALNPENLRAYLTQQRRWFVGTFQLIQAFNPVFAKNLTLPQKLCCCIDAYCYFSFFPRLVCALAPALFLLFYLCPSRAFVVTYLAVWFPWHVLMLLSTQRVFGKHLLSAHSDLYQVLRAPFFMVEFLQSSLKRFGAEFQTTPKGLRVGEVAFDFKLIAPHMVLLGITALGSIIGVLKLILGSIDPLSNAITLSWNFYNTLMFLCCVCAAVDRPEPLEMYGLITDLPVTLCELGGKPDQAPIEGRLVYASECGGTIILQDSESPLKTQRLSVLACLNGTNCALNSRLVSTISSGGTTRLEVAFAPNDTDLQELKNFVKLTVSSNGNWQTREMSDFGVRKVNYLTVLFGSPLAVLRDVLKAKTRGGF